MMGLKPIVNFRLMYCNNESLVQSLLLSVFLGLLKREAMLKD